MGTIRGPRNAEVEIVVLASFELWFVHKCRCVAGDVCSSHEQRAPVILKNKVVPSACFPFFLLCVFSCPPLTPPLLCWVFSLFGDTHLPQGTFQHWRGGRWGGEVASHYDFYFRPQSPVGQVLNGQAENQPEIPRSAYLAR